MTTTATTDGTLPAAQLPDGPRLPGPLTSVVQALLRSVDNALRPSVARSIIQPGGQVAWDCCTDGQVWVRVIEIAPYNSSTPRPNCPPAGFDAILGVGVVRCVSGMDDNGRPPAASDLSADGLQMLDDLHTIEQVVLALDPPGRALKSLDLMRWAPMGPEGGCTGQEWEVRAKVDNCG